MERKEPRGGTATKTIAVRGLSMGSGNARDDRVIAKCGNSTEMTALSDPSANSMALRAVLALV
jgi:hypothetical protein